MVSSNKSIWILGGHEPVIENIEVMTLSQTNPGAIFEYIYTIFGHCTDKIKDSVFLQVARLLQLAWSNYFCHRFPTRKIVVECIIDEREYGPVLFFYQNRDV